MPVFAADGVLARALPGFEPRQSQVEMSAAVARAFEHGGVLLAEAGITPTTVRMSVGLEDTDDVVADVRRALDAAFA